MTQVDPNVVAAAAIQNLQDAITRLDAQKQQQNADIPGIDTQINALEAQQADLQNQALRTIEDSAANQQAIAAMNAAAASLKNEASNITDLATALASAAKVATAVASLAAALAPFA
jgi:hypothetical protein